MGQFIKVFAGQTNNRRQWERFKQGTILNGYPASRKRVKSLLSVPQKEQDLKLQQEKEITVNPPVLINSTALDGTVLPCLYVSIFE